MKNKSVERGRNFTRKRKDNGREVKKYIIIRIERKGRVGKRKVRQGDEEFDRKLTENIRKKAKAK